MMHFNLRTITLRTLEPLLQRHAINNSYKEYIVIFLYSTFFFFFLFLQMLQIWFKFNAIIISRVFFSLVKIHAYLLETLFPIFCNCKTIALTHCIVLEWKPAIHKKMYVYIQKCFTRTFL